MNWLAFAGLMGASFTLALISFGLGVRLGLKRGLHFGGIAVLNTIKMEYNRRPPHEQAYIDELIKSANDNAVKLAERSNR